MNIHRGLSGRYRIEAHDPETGSTRLLADWFENLITDNGLDLVGSSASYTSCCQVGTGATAASNSDTTLQSYVAGTNTVSSTETGVSGSSPYYAYLRKKYDFALGAVVGNMSEVGVGTTTTTGNLFSRALIVDGGGSPTTVSVLVTEQLRVTYELRFYAYETDVTGSMLVGGVSTSYTLRPANANTNVGTPGAQATFTSDGTVYPSTSTLGAITSTPSGGGTLLISGASVGSYVSSSHEVVGTFSMGTTSGNASGGIGCMRLSTTLGVFQISFSPAIDKDNTKTLSMEFTISWGRYVAP